ncbi:MAG: AraC family transcriptional regulator [Saprospiraceae bacterium]
MHFKPSVLEVSTIKADKNIHNYLVERMQEEKSGIHAYTDHLLKASYQMILEALPSGIPSINQMAEHQGMSARTFKRRLSGKGWTFRALVQNIQQEVAVNLLRNSKQSMAEIAFQTGFSEQSAFNRAFKRWTGQSPLEFRNSA